MIDKAVFRSVFADFDAEIINQIIKIYIKEHPVKFRDMEAAFEQRDFSNLRGVAHGLKGVLSQFFAAEAQQQAKELEFYARELSEYYADKPGAEIEEEHKARVEEMIETLKASSLKVIDALKEIGEEYKEGA